MGKGRRRRPEGRPGAVRIKTAKGRKPSSARWLRRQLKDPYVARARGEGYRSRAAYKLIEIDDRFHLLEPGRSVLDLGAAPGGWTQVAVRRVRAGAPGGGRVIAVDAADMDLVPGAEHLRLDVLDAAAEGRLKEALGGPADVVLSDMAAPATGIARVDHLRATALCEAAYAIAEQVLAPGGAFVAKVLGGGGEAALVKRLKRAFRTVKHVKPPASRPGSAELYLVATGFRGGEPAADG